MRYGMVLILAMLVPALPLAAQNGRVPDVTEEVRWRIEGARAMGAVRVGGDLVHPADLTLHVYEERDFRPLWNRGAVEGLLLAIAQVRDDGLDPEDYGLAALVRAASRGQRPSSVAELDILATDALVRVGRDLRFGKTPPRGPASPPDAPWAFGGLDAVAKLVDVVESGRVRQALNDQRPQHFTYRTLRRMLAELRRIRSAGGWTAVPPGPTLLPDSSDARVPLLRRRLALEGYLNAEAGHPDLRFDPILEEAVRTFQQRHGLNEDGLVGRATLAALNVPVERRIEQVRVNLERARWITHELPDTFVVVNAAGAMVYLLHGDRVVYESRAIVGTVERQTPLLAAPMLNVDLNPTWTIPRGIVDEVLERARADPGYLERQQKR